MFEAEHVATRDQTLHDIERLARRSGRSELSVAQTLLDLMHDGRACRQRHAAVASHWLRGAGRPALARALGLHERAGAPWRAAARRVALPVYLGSLLLGTAGLVAWLLLRHGAAAGRQRRLRVAGPARRGTDAVPGLRSGGGGDQPADQRVGAAQRTCRGWPWPTASRPSTG